MYRFNSLLHQAGQALGRRPCPRAWPIPPGAQCSCFSHRSTRVSARVGPQSTIRVYKRWRPDGWLRTAGQTQLSPHSYHNCPPQQDLAPEAPTPETQNTLGQNPGQSRSRATLCSLHGPSASGHSLLSASCMPVPSSPSVPHISCQALCSVHTVLRPRPDTPGLGGTLSYGGPAL